MKSEQWKTYRTRFLVNAKQLNSSLSFVDHLGRQHCGRKGDYLVESSDGVISIAPRHIFEDIYVPISLSESAENRQSILDLNGFSDAALERLKFEALQIQELKLSAPPQGDANRQGQPRNYGTASIRRKLPQPCRERRDTATNFRLM